MCERSRYESLNVFEGRDHTKVSCSRCHNLWPEEDTYPHFGKTLCGLCADDLAETETLSNVEHGQ
jgi:formylmethanofuran dehydrogenase subunit E